MTVIALPANQPETFYRGGGRISAFRGAPLPDRPEDWVASTTSRFGLAPSGLTTLPDGRLLAEAVAADPRTWVGPDREDTGILVKLLDAGQRLPMHVHPDRRFAHEHLSSPYGKTEAWVVLSAEPDAFVHLGFSRDVSPGELAGWVRDQDVAQMLAATNRVPIRAGDALLCPAGMPHAIGAGVLVAEIQEPTDFSVLLEYEGFALDGPAEGHLRLGYDLALECVDRRRCDPDRIAALRGDADRLLPAEAESFFTATRLHGPGTARLDAAFSIVVVTDGEGRLTGEHDDAVVRRGDTVLIPYAAGPLTLTGAVEAVRFSPPRE